ncbi:ornithine cyclodeaminase [Amycolatopsis xylanica]|uniref:Ornithine cyclodeaminase n=1 Tax=Amycolatopsis xylanica TaxID=589385 RepID=A0A1H3SX67_9PSEU|nr:ornithine cyclodeaminase [Amycolatopsis xylanica]SDZ42228.1 ornithine cyclodeaminase [Amycolatopsis xylanica]
MLTASEVRKLISMPDAVAAVRAAFLDLAAGEFTQPTRLSFGGGRALVMSAYHAGSGAAVVKTLSVELERSPAILGTLVWSSADGQLVADAIEVTTLRTGAVSGVATDLLAAPDASRLTVLGAGAQAADQVRAVAAVRPLASVTVHARTSARASALISVLRKEFPAVEFAVSGTADEAVSAADVVCCATSASEPVFDAAALPENVHVNAIGSYLPSMRELPEELLASARVVVVDEVGACMEEAGEVIHAVSTGSLKRDSLVELGSALTDPPGVGGRTVFKSVGVAAQDWALARLLAQGS